MNSPFIDEGDKISIWFIMAGMLPMENAIVTSSEYWPWIQLVTETGVTKWLNSTTFFQVEVKTDEAPVDISSI